MATPLTQSMFKPTDFDLFLDEIGLDNLSPGSRIELIDQITQSVEYAFVNKIFRLLSTDDQLHLVELMKQADESHSEVEVNKFLLEKMPDVEALVDEAIDEVKNQLRLSTHGMQHSIDKLVAELRPDEMAKLVNPEGQTPAAPPPEPATLPPVVEEPATPPTAEAEPDSLEAMNNELDAIKQDLTNQNGTDKA